MQLFRLLSLVISIIAVVGCNRFFPCILDTVCVCVSSHTAHGIMALIGYAGGTALVQSIVWFDLHQTSTQTYFMRLPIFGIESKMGIRMSGDGEGKKTRVQLMHMHWKIEQRRWPANAFDWNIAFRWWFTSFCENQFYSLCRYWHFKYCVGSH